MSGSGNKQGGLHTGVHLQNYVEFLYCRYSVIIVFFVCKDEMIADLELI